MNLLDLFFPKRCVNCGKVGQYFCNRCQKSIRPIATNESICPVCEKLAIDGYTHPGCRSRYAPDGLTSFFHYDGPIRKAIKQIKYRFVSDLVSDFVSLAPISLCKNIPSDCHVVIPIPLYKKRQRERGFNQAEELAKSLAQQLHIPMNTGILHRTRETAPQVAMRHRKDRLKNMEDVFAIPADATDTFDTFDTVMLFDDVFTTGATMRSAANVLKRNGAKFVWAVTMAR